VNSLEANAVTATKELSWFSVIVTARGAISFNNSTGQQPVDAIKPPDVADDTSPYAAIIRHFNMSHAERFILILSLVPHLQPQLLDMLLMKNSETGQPFTQLGGQRTAQGNYLPTGETAVFILAGNDLAERYKLLQMFDSNHFFATQNILQLQRVGLNESRLSGTLTPTVEYQTLLTTGEQFKPDYTANFPAKRLLTGLDWSDLVVADEVMRELDEIKMWLEHGNTLLYEWGFLKKIKPGFRVIFSGPPGTGKTLTAALLGKSAGLDVYRLDLSMIVSKYIGETEKNLANVFDMAENKNWILFFDEADALFGKRTSTSDSKDRYANQQVSYLLQRIEDYTGLVILATNFKNNVDEAFARRFQVMAEFQKPDESQRLQLWNNAFTSPCTLAPEVNLPKLAAEYSITGAAIMNILRFCSLRALGRGNTEINITDIKQGIRKEMHKEGKAFF
jgi:DNA polymerase III delta prime subunit